MQLGIHEVPLMCVGYDLSSRLVAKQVFSALQSLTSVFGMGTGGPSALETLTLRRTQSALVHLQGFEPRDASRTHMIKSRLLAQLLSLI